MTVSNRSGILSRRRDAANRPLGRRSDSGDDGTLSGDGGAVWLGFWSVFAAGILTGMTSAKGIGPGASASGAPAGVIVERERGETKRFRWDFGRENDLEARRWPDGWQRMTAPGYPAYVPIRIVPHDREQEQTFRELDIALVRAYEWAAERWPEVEIPFPPSLADRMVDRYLRVDLDGGLVMVRSPAVETSSMYQYRLRCRMMTEGLRYDRARVELVFVDGDSNELAAHATSPVTGTTPWTSLELDQLRPPPEATGMLVRFLVEGSEDGLEDIRGAIGVDDIVIEKFPQLGVTTDASLGVYPSGRRPVARAKLLGLPSVSSKLRFGVHDWDGVEVASRTFSLDGDQVSVRRSAATGGAPASVRELAAARESGKGRESGTGPALGGGSSALGARDSVEAEVEWQLPPLGPGWYRVSATLVDDQIESLESDTTLAVIDELVAGPTHGVFGWTLPDGLSGPGGTYPIEPRGFGNWLADLGVAWIKFPCWVAPDDDVAADRVASVLTRLQDHGIRTVGMLDEPPASELEDYDVRGRRIPHVAELLRDRETWQPLLEPVMTRLTLKVKLWQLGADGDHSFVGRPGVDESIRDIARGLQGFGQPIEVAISWPWMEPVPPASRATWHAVSRSSDPQLSADELDAYLGRAESERGGPNTWLSLGPVSAQNYDRDQRVRDLVMRMASVKKHAVQAAFVPDPRDPEFGLLRADGRPGEMLLPWRTAARLIGNLKHVGSLRLRSGAENAVFTNGQRAVLMVWNSEPTEDLIYLGTSPRHVDVLGREIELPSEQYDGETVHRIRIGRSPSFLIDIDPILLEFRMSVELDRKQLDSVLGDRQRLGVNFRNPGRDNLAGEVRIEPPETWDIESETPYWELAAGRRTRHPFQVVLGNSASVGSEKLAIRFRLQTNPPQELTVYRDLHVGPEGLEIRLHTRLLDNGDLEVRLEMTNESDSRQAYDCLLFPGQGRRFERRMVSLDAGETIVRLFYLPDGEKLVGQSILLRASEQDGRRVLNYSEVVTGVR